jgi:hypothetical protein
MAHSVEGDPFGKYGLIIKDEDGDTEQTWFGKKSDRDKTYKNMLGQPGLVKVEKNQRK